MNPHFLLKLSLWGAGTVHLLICLANFFLPSMLDYRSNLRRVSPMIRQVFRAHAAYIVATVAGFGLLCFFFTDDLAGGSALGRCLSAFFAVFWWSRLLVQYAYYDADIKRARPWGNAVFTAAFLYLGATFTAAVCFGHAFHLPTPP